MDTKMIATLLEKYWQVETTVEEEKVLADFFRQAIIPAEWEPYRQLFGYYEAEGQLEPGEDFDKKVLQSLGLDSEATRPKGLIRRAPWWAAAAVILLSLGTVLWGDHGTGSGHPQPDTKEQLSSTTIKDTYDDPQEALAAIRKALMKASSGINKGKNITKKEMGRMKNNWQMAVNY
jgi:hypothetical protein